MLYHFFAVLVHVYFKLVMSEPFSSGCCYPVSGLIWQRHTWGHTGYPMGGDPGHTDIGSTHRTSSLTCKYIFVHFLHPSQWAPQNIVCSQWLLDTPSRQGYIPKLHTCTCFSNGLHRTMSVPNAMHMILSAYNIWMYPGYTMCTSQGIQGTQDTGQMPQEGSLHLTPYIFTLPGFL